MSNNKTPEDYELERYKAKWDNIFAITAVIISSTAFTICYVAYCMYSGG